MRTSAVLGTRVATTETMLETLIVVLLILWLLGYFGPARVPAIPRTGNVVHLLLVIVLILIILRLPS